MFEYAFVGVAASMSSPAFLSAAFGSTNGTVPADVDSATRTWTVPGGDSRSLDFDTTNTTGGTFQYSKNGGAFATLSDGADISFVTGDTLAFRIDNPSAPGAFAQVIITDNVFGVTVGSWTANLSE